MLIVSLVIAVILILFVILLPNQNKTNCEPSITTASGSSALPVCSGRLIFVENFDRLDKNRWQPEVTLSDGSVSAICV